MAIGSLGSVFLVILFGLGSFPSNSYAKAKPTIVPLLVGMDVSDPKLATHHLKDGAFKLVVSKREKNRNVHRGRILSQAPKAGTLGKPYSSIFVVVSDGP